MTWRAVFNRYKQRGHDPSSAAYAADQWKKRQNAIRWRTCQSTHCERRHECASPHECSAEGRIARERKTHLTEKDTP